MLSLCRLTLIVMLFTLYGGAVASAQPPEAVPAPAPSVSALPQQPEAAAPAKVEIRYLPIVDQKLVDNARSLNDIQASSSLIFLTYRAIEAPDVVVGNSIPERHLYELTFDLVKEFSFYDSRTRQSAAAQCIKDLITSANNPDLPIPTVVGGKSTFEWLLAELTLTYQQMRSDNTKLALLGAANESLKTELAAFDRANQNIAAAGATLKAKKADLAAITFQNSQLDAFLEKTTSANLSKALLKHLTEKVTGKTGVLEKLAPVNSAQDLEHALNIVDFNLQLVEQFLRFAEREALIHPAEDRRISSLIKEVYINKLQQFKLEQEVEAIKKKITGLQEGRGDEILKRNALALIEFLSNTQHATSSRLVQEVANGLSASASSALIKYSESSAYDEAGAFLAVTSGSFLVPGAIGARTSAVDIPSATDSRTSGSRPGVANTAPFDPALDPKKPSQFPESDYRGKRKPSVDPFPENTQPPKKATGAAGATPAQ